MIEGVQTLLRKSDPAKFWVDPDVDSSSVKYLALTLYRIVP